MSKTAVEIAYESYLAFKKDGCASTEALLKARELAPAQFRKKNGEVNRHWLNAIHCLQREMEMVKSWNNKIMNK